MKKEILNIAVVSFDWKNLFEEDFSQLVSKLKRDRLEPEKNNFFFFSWGQKGYSAKKGNIETVHVRSFFGKNRVFCDLFSVFCFSLALFNKKFRPDVVLAFDFPLLFSGLFAKLFLKSKLVMFLPNLPNELARTRENPDLKYFYLLFWQYLSKHLADYYFVISSPTRKYLLDIGVDNKKIRQIVPDTISFDREAIEKVQKGKIRKKFSIPEQARIFLSVGRLEPEKNFELLIRSFIKLARKDVYLLIAGGGKEEEKLKHLAEGSDRIIFAGPVKKENIWNYYQDVDAFILLSRSEGLGMVFWEAMYMGVPVIGSRIPAVAESIGQNEERGFLWSEQEGFNVLQEKMNECLENRILLSEKLSMAKRYVEQKIKSGKTINELIEL